MKVIAPGKVMVAGEYAVLTGHRAVVMAVDRYATAAATEEVPEESPPEVRSALQCARREGLLASDHAVRVETSGFSHDGCKLGLGSSAAGCVAALGCALALQGHSLDELRPKIAQVARAGHREAQGGGSGVDVLTSALGGTIQVRWPDGLEGSPLVTKLCWPPGLVWSVFWTGTSARTSTLIRSVRHFAAQNPKEMSDCINAICAATDDLTVAFETALAERAIHAVRAHMKAMDRLGRASNTPIVTESMRHFAAAVEPLGAAVKPSGAGGGDIVIAMMPDPDVLLSVQQLARGLGFIPLELQLDVHGVRLAQGALKD